MATGLENLWIYKLAEDLEIKVHELTKKFPKDEIFRSVDQIRRSSASVANNIAESYHKKSIKDKESSLTISKGEAEETKRNILKSARKFFIAHDIASNIADQYTVLLKGTNAYIRFIKLDELKKQHKEDKKPSTD